MRPTEYDNKPFIFFNVSFQRITVHLRVVSSGTTTSHGELSVHHAPATA